MLTPLSVSSLKMTWIWVLAQLNPLVQKPFLHCSSPGLTGADWTRDFELHNASIYLEHPGKSLIEMYYYVAVHFEAISIHLEFWKTNKEMPKSDSTSRRCTRFHFCKRRRSIRRGQCFDLNDQFVWHLGVVKASSFRHNDTLSIKCQLWQQQHTWLLKGGLW